MKKTAPAFQTIMLVMVAFLMLIPAGAIGSDTRPDYSKIDPLLQKEMKLRTLDENIETIIQFKDEVTDSDLAVMKQLDINVLLVYHVLPAVYAKGSVSSILELSGYYRTSWMEYNQENELALHETTTVIKATTPWASEVRWDDNDYSEFELNPQSKLNGLDGSGVTVVVVDTGIDGQHPDLDYGEKLILNKHKNGPEEPWVEMENSDTSYGHGTHCAGIVAGNGDASAGQKRGVAPGATLIGVGGDWTPVYWVVLEGLEWVYDNSKPGNNPYNIRVISNSWGGAGDYEPQDAVSQVCNKLTYENSVLCVFAAMNSGEGNHDGAIDSTSAQSKVPSVLSVAASTHAGDGLAVFSSRGKKGDWYTYPDITAPGVNIWATRPRYTWISESQLVDEDMYYMAISGTSMATPHVSGLAAIMFQAAPSLRTSEHFEDDNSGKDWGSGHDPRIHEVEYILKMTSDMIEPTGSNGIPAQDEWESGLNGYSFDYGQGYGQVNSEKALAVALTLEKLRQEDNSATVDDALAIFEDVLTTGKFTEETDTLLTSWRGDWAQLTNGSNPVSSSSFSTDQSHRVFVPEEGEFMAVELMYNPVDANLGTTGRIELTLDWNGDSQNDIMPQPFDFDGTKRYEIDLTVPPASDNKGKWWVFNVEGEGMKLYPKNNDDEFHEAIIEYQVDLMLRFEDQTHVEIDVTQYPVDTSPWRFDTPSNDFSGCSVTLEKPLFDVSNARMEEDKGILEDIGFDTLVPTIMVGLLVITGIFLYFKKR